MQVPYGEGVANQTDPEFCGGGSNNALNGGVVLKPSVPTHKLKVGSLLPLWIITIREYGNEWSSRLNPKLLNLYWYIHSSIRNCRKIIYAVSVGNLTYSFLFCCFAYKVKELKSSKAYNSPSLISGFAGPELHIIIPPVNTAALMVLPELAFLPPMNDIYCRIGLRKPTPAEKDV